MKNQIARAAIFIFITFQFGCSPQTDEQKIEQLNNVDMYSEFRGLVDEDSIAMDKIQEMEESDNPQLDMEDKVEILSNKDKILIVGDSWATFPCLYNSMGKMIDDVNAKITEDNRCLRTTKLGVEAAQWIGSKQDLRVIRFLKNTPRIKYLYLSLGGNDLMGNWNKSFTPEQELKLFADTFNTVQKIMNNYLSIRPDIKIVLSGYDFPNFKPNHKIGLYKKIYEKMGSPTELRINRALVGFTQFMVPIANKKNTFYVHHLGLSQYYDGVPEKNLPARATLSPDEISPWNDPSIVGGNINFQSSDKSMINWLFLVRDAFHLNTRMYKNLMIHTYYNSLSHIIP
jgi:hypothetical protein